MVGEFLFSLVVGKHIQRVLSKYVMERTDQREWKNTWTLIRCLKGVSTLGKMEVTANIKMEEMT